MQGLSRTAEIIYNQLLTATKKEVAKASLTVMNSLQTKPTAVQLLALGALTVILLNGYDLTAADVLGIAHNMVYSGDNNNASKDFQVLQNFIKEEWEL